MRPEKTKTRTRVTGRRFNTYGIRPTGREVNREVEIVLYLEALDLERTILMTLRGDSAS